MSIRALNLCGGAGGLALGMERVGFGPITVVDADARACAGLARNRPGWRVVCEGPSVSERDDFVAGSFDVIAAGLPSPMLTGTPTFKSQSLRWTGDEVRGAVDWSAQDMQAGTLKLVSRVRPQAVVLENVAGLASDRAADYRTNLVSALKALGYMCDWQVLHAQEFGLPQTRPRFILIALLPRVFASFQWPRAQDEVPTVGQFLEDLMASNGWTWAHEWAMKADTVGPTLVGGSRRRGGADLGPTGSRVAWKRLGVRGQSLAAEAPGSDELRDHRPRLTVDMAARYQGFPDGWHVEGTKTQRYRLIAGGCPPPVAAAIFEQIGLAIESCASV